MHSPKMLLLLGLSACALPAGAQSIGPAAIDAAGGSATAAGITHEYAIGQIVAGNTFSSATLVVTPGVLQPQLNATGVAGTPAALAGLSVFPNPASDVLFLQPAFSGGGALGYDLYDGAGRLLLHGEAALLSGSERQRLSLSPFAAGQYHLRVTWLQGGQTSAAAYNVQKLH